MSSQIDKSKIPPNAIKACQMLQDAGYEAYLVGGCVRDLLMGESPKDFDITTNAKPQESEEIFSPKKEGDKYPKYYETGIAHGTITVALGPNKDTDHFEVTVYRSEGDYSDGRRPEEVFFEQDLTKDLERRDLTINAIAYDPVNDTIEDPFGGQQDLAKRKIKAVGNADKRFQEDGLRTMRAARFAARFNFDLEEDTRQAISNNLTTLSKVSKERLQDELMKTLKTKDPKKGLEILRDTGCLSLLGESLSSNTELSNNIDKLNYCSNPISRLSLLLCGAPLTEIEGNLRFLKFSNNDIKKVYFLVKKISELKSAADSLNDPLQLKKFVAAFKNEAKENYDQLVADFVEIARALNISAEKILQSGSEEVITEKDFKKVISGNDLISMGVPAGPFIKEILSNLYDRVVAGELPLDKNKLREEAKNIWESKNKQAKLNKRMRMIKLAQFWKLSPEEELEWLKKEYDFGPYGKYEAGELPHIRQMIDVPAGPELHHPEKNQAIHNHMVYEQARRLSEDPRDWYAAALHDLGKVYKDKSKYPKQYGHEVGGVPYVESLSDELKVPDDWKDIAKLVAEHHLKGHTARELKPSTLNKLFESLKNKKNMSTFLTAIDADQKGRLGKEDEPHPNVDYLKQKWEEFNNPVPVPQKIDLNINLKEIIPPGPKFGALKKFLEKAIRENPTLNNEISLKEMANFWLQSN